jgi:hypothetical protein
MKQEEMIYLSHEFNHERKHPIPLIQLLSSAFFEETLHKILSLIQLFWKSVTKMV